MRRPSAARLWQLLARYADRPVAPYQSALLRIGVAATWLLFLLREFPNRHELYGPDGPWSFTLAQELVEQNGSFTVLFWFRSELWFECVYAAALLSSLLLLLGRHCRASAVLFMVGVLSLQNRSVLLGDGGDNLVHLLALYLILVRCGEVWSLDARVQREERRAARGARRGVLLWCVLGAVLLLAALGGRLPLGWGLLLLALWGVQALWWWACTRRPGGELHRLLSALANLVHLTGLAVVMAQVCLVYATAGWYKIQGSRWQDGTAVYYALNLQSFSPWPALGHALGQHGMLIMVLSYGTVLLQVAFPFSLLNRRAKNVLLVLLTLEHLGIAFLLGLPFFSLVMLAADAVFLPTSLLLRTDALARRAGDALRARVRSRPKPPARTASGDTFPIPEGNREAEQAAEAGS